MIEVLGQGDRCLSVYEHLLLLQGTWVPDVGPSHDKHNRGLGLSSFP